MLRATGGVVVKAIAGIAVADVEGFVASLTQASVALGGIPARLEAARVHDVAFGKLVDAAKVRDAYHARLPATEQNIAEARELIAHMITQFGGEPVPDPEPISVVTVPAQGGPESVVEPAVPEQVVPEQAAPDSASVEQSTPDPDPDPDPVTVSLPGPRTGQTADG
jgi:hypothetical protein